MNEVTFSDLGLSTAILKDLTEQGFKTPMPIQEVSIPLLMQGEDLIAQAKTGTGKTLAFAIPIVEGLDEKKRNVQALILTPTRELAEQVRGEIVKISRTRKVRCEAFYGGKSIVNQEKALKRGVHVVVGTPGRIIDLINRGILDLGEVGILVLDEADRMLDMGFIDDIKKITSHIPKERQTMLFSATIPEYIMKLSHTIMKDPEIVSISPEELTVEEIEQIYYETHQNEKFETFMEIVKKEKPHSAIVFCNTKRWTETLSKLMGKRGLRVGALHGDMTQNQRDRVMESFRRKNLHYMVATDVAARGIDIDDISHVFNYDIPKDKENYVHRIGRTGRAGKTGKAISFITPGEIHDLWSIEHTCRTKIAEGKIELPKKKRFKPGKERERNPYLR